MASRTPPSNFIPGFTYFVAYFSILRILVFLAFRFQNLRQGKGEILSFHTHSGFFFFFLNMCACVSVSCMYYFCVSNSMELRLNQLFTRPSHEAHYKHALTHRHSAPTRTKAQLHSSKHTFFCTQKTTHTPKEGAVPPGATSVTC